MSHRLPSSTLSPSDLALSRRSFLRRVLALGAAGLGGTTLLAACGDGTDGSTGAGGTEAVTASSCEGYDALAPAALKTRTSLGYVDASPREDQHCANCRFSKQPQAGSPCSGCQLFPGPVSPGGWCQSWTMQAV